MTLLDEGGDAERGVAGTPSPTSGSLRSTDVIRGTTMTTPPLASDEARYVFQGTPEVRPPTKHRSAEKFCVRKDGELEYTEEGKELHVFSRTAISAELANRLKPTAAFLDMELLSNFRAIGSASLLEYEDQGEAKKVLVTAKHNVFRDSVNDEETYSAILKTQSGAKCQVFDNRAFSTDSREDGPINLRLNEAGELMQWDFGVDVLAISSMLVSDRVLESLQPFALGRHNFEFEIGQKVGIITWNDEGACPQSVKAAKPMGYDDVCENYGRRNDVNLYTGEIKYVGENHIEHDINTYSGCAGSLIFILDRQEMGSVDEADHGKVVAIHVGSKNGMPYNVGLKLVGEGAEPLVLFGGL